MKKQKLALSRETIRQLQGPSLSEVVGGSLRYSARSCAVGTAGCQGVASYPNTLCGSGPIIITPIESITGNG